MLHENGEITALPKFRSLFIGYVIFSTCFYNFYITYNWGNWVIQSGLIHKL